MNPIGRPFVGDTRLVCSSATTAPPLAAIRPAPPTVDITDRPSPSQWSPVPELRAAGRRPELAISLPRRSTGLWRLYSGPKGIGIGVASRHSTIEIESLLKPTLSVEEKDDHSKTRARADGTAGHDPRLRRMELRGAPRGRDITEQQAEII